MKIRVCELRQLIREELQKLHEMPVMSTLSLKPGMKLRYTGDDMEIPAFLKVLSVAGDSVTVGDKFGKVRKISSKDLHAGVFYVMN